MNEDLFEKGLVTIRTAIESTLRDRGVAGVVAQSRSQGGTGDTDFSVTVAEHTQTSRFEHPEIIDSALAVDAPVAHKIRMLVGPFVR